MRKELKEARTHRGVTFSIWWDQLTPAPRDGYWRWAWRDKRRGLSAAGVAEHKTRAVFQARHAIDAHYPPRGPSGPHPSSPPIAPDPAGGPRA